MQKSYCTTKNRRLFCWFSCPYSHPIWYIGVNHITLEYLIAVDARTFFGGGFSLTHALIGYLHDFQNSSLPRKIFAFGSIWKTFLTKNVNYGHFIHLHDFSNEKRQKKNKMFIHNTFYEFREFGCFRKIPRSTLIRYLHDLKDFS